MQNLKVPESPLLSSLIRKTFTRPNIHPVILRGAEGEVAESINKSYKRLFRFTVEEKNQAKGFNNPAEDRQDS